MSTSIDVPVGSDPQEDEDEAEQDFTICPTCGEDLPHHLCDGRSRAEAE
jgi:ribosomal protein L32